MLTSRAHPLLFALLGSLALGCAGGTVSGETPIVEDIPVNPPRDIEFDKSVEDAATEDITVVTDDADATDATDAPPLSLPDLGTVIDTGAPQPVDVAVTADVPARCQAAGACTPGMVRECGRCGVQRCFEPCDWGTCASEGECMSGMTRACNGCGTQTCASSCTWGACQGGGGTCTPGQTRACGNCGTQTCTSSCAWGGCSNEGACAPGQTRTTGCDGCSQQTCGMTCQWGGCALRAGAACEYRSGTNARACSACRCGRQWCLSSCQWSTSCTSCCSGCGGCLAP
jgi:hypothetical protein